MPVHPDYLLALNSIMDGLASISHAAQDDAAAIEAAATRTAAAAAGEVRHIASSAPLANAVYAVISERVVTSASDTEVAALARAVLEVADELDGLAGDLR